VDWSLELVVVPVADVDRAKAFYLEQAGFNLDVDTTVGDHFRVVQLTPPGSACSISIGSGLGQAAPGSAQGLHLVVADIEAAGAELAGRGPPDVRPGPKASEVRLVPVLQGSGPQRLVSAGGQPRGVTR